MVELKTSLSDGVDQLAVRFNPPGHLGDVEHPVQENGAVRIIVPLGPVAELGHMIPDPFQPRPGLLCLRRIREQLDPKCHAAAVSERVIVRMLRAPFEIKEPGLKALINDFFHRRLFRIGEHVLSDEFLEDSHPARPTPTAVIAAAVMIATQCSSALGLALHLVSAVGGEENIK